jgi:hypothetical protein
LPTLLRVGRGVTRLRPASSPAYLVFTCRQIITRAHARGIRVYGATLLPFTPDGEAIRREVNDWIRRGGAFDAVIDLDAATRDPERPSHLSAAVDGGDHLHPPQPATS